MTSGKLRLCLLHGWGYGPALWREVLPLLGGYPVDLADFGYFGPPALPAEEEPQCIAVGHSLGALWWLARRPDAWQALVCINGFSRFTASTDFAEGVAPRVLTRMRRRFDATPAAVLAEFRSSCAPGLPTPSDSPSDSLFLSTATLSSLGHGLAALAELDGRAALLTHSQRIWALASRDDAIVPAALSARAFAALPATHLQWLDQGGHLLPLAQPAACADLIRAAVASLSTTS